MLRRRWTILLPAACALLALSADAPPARAASHADMASRITPVPGVPGTFRLETSHGTRTLTWPPPQMIEVVPDVVINGLGNTWDSPAAGDTLVVAVGARVRWHRATGIHTITDGAGAEDPDAGQHFDYLLDDLHADFDSTFLAPDTVNYFCWFHDPDMRGVLIISANASVPVTPEPPTLRFARPPSPNPTRGTMSFTVLFPTDARVEVDVWDLFGRHVASVARDDLGAGEHTFRWDGRTARGDRAATGTYLVRVKANDTRISRRFTLIR